MIFSSDHLLLFGSAHSAAWGPRETTSTASKGRFLGCAAFAFMNTSFFKVFQSDLLKVPFRDP